MLFKFIYERQGKAIGKDDELLALNGGGAQLVACAVARLFRSRSQPPRYPARDRGQAHSSLFAVDRDGNALRGEISG